MIKYIICVFTDASPPVQPGLSEDELGGSQEVHQWSHQQNQCVKHHQHHPGAAAGEHRQGEVNKNIFSSYHIRFKC